MQKPSSVRCAMLEKSLILSGLVLSSISDGYIFGQMSGMLADLQSKDSDIPLSEDDISWIAATINATCVCGFGLVSIVSEKFGRRRAITILTAPLIVVWIMVYYASCMLVFMASRILVGFCYGGVVLLTFMATAEYVSPNIRGLCLNAVSSVGPAAGTTLAHVLGVLLHWRIVALIGIIPAGLSALLPCFWVESPSWLASKGKFKQCEASFRALHKQNKSNETELELLIEVEKLKLRRSQEQCKTSVVKKLISAIKQKYFWRLALVTTVISLYRAAAGKVLFSTLAATMLQEMTRTSDILLFTLLVDVCSILGACLSCFLISKMKMRSLLFSSALVANAFLIALSACLYFKPENDLYFPWINCTLLALYFITVNAGPYPVLDAMMAEIFLLEIKGYCSFLFGTAAGTIHFFTIKLAPSMFTAMGYHGVFLLYVGVMSCCLLYFWVRLPETKGRTLQEIELYFKNNTFDKVEELLNGDQMKVLV